MKKCLQTIVFGSCILGLISPAYSDITGSWSTTGKITVSAKAKGIKTVKLTDNETDTVDFKADHTFQMHYINIDGIWSQVKTKWKIASVNTAEVESFLEAYILAKWGYHVGVTLISFTASGSQGKTGATIKGKISIKASFIDYDYGINGTASARVGFTGVPAPAGAPGVQSDTVTDLRTALAESLAEAIRDLRNSP